MRLALASLVISLASCAAPETITIRLDKAGETTVTVHRPSATESATKGAVGGVFDGIAKLFD